MTLDAIDYNLLSDKHAKVVVSITNHFMKLKVTLTY